MDTPNNNERQEGSGTSKMRTRTISFLPEDYGFNRERIRNYLESEDGKRVGIVAAVTVVAILVLSILASISLPGQAFYGLKTNVFENVGGMFSWTTESKARHNLTLMRERLVEVKRLGSREPVSENAVATFSSQVQKNAQAFVLLTEGSEERTLDREVVINLTNDFASVASAIEEVAEDHESLLPVADTVGDVRRAATRRLGDEIEVYVSLAPDEDLRGFITDELQRIGDRVARGDLGEDTTNRVGRSLADVAQAIAVNDAPDAVEAIFEAKRLIAAEEYLEKKE